MGIHSVSRGNGLTFFILVNIASDLILLEFIVIERTQRSKAFPL